SGLSGEALALARFLEETGIRTLLFTGINTDQSVIGTLLDAYNQGFDCILLGDGCGTDSPRYAQLSVEYSCRRNWGFLSSCEGLYNAANEM
ncbi:hypothetical protein B0T24DRAFT_525750, partial [Lasiosphaeria ovina]